MFQEEYIRDLRSNYLVLSEADQAYDEFQIKMLMNNRIKGLLECEIRIIDGQEKFLYEISSKQPISRIYERTKLDYDTLISILRGIAGAVESAGEYLLDTRHFILQPEYMYMNPETKKISLCFFPLYEAEPEQAFHKLAEYVLDKIDYQEERAVVLAYDFYRRAKEDNFNIRSVLNKPVSLGKDICFEQNPVRKRSPVAEEKPQEPPEQNKKPVKELVEEKEIIYSRNGNAHSANRNFTMDTNLPAGDLVIFKKQSATGTGHPGRNGECGCVGQFCSDQQNILQKKSGESRAG